MQQIGVDLLEWGRENYLVMLDHYSGYPFMHMLQSLTISSMIICLNVWFLHWGYP